MPHSGNYCGDHQSTNCDCMLIRADFPVTPENVEIVEVAETQGWDAAALRGKQLDRNWQRRRLNSDRKRYEARALELNIRRAAEVMAKRIVAQKPVDEKLASATDPHQGTTSVVPEIVEKDQGSSPCGSLAISDTRSGGASAPSEADTQPPKKPVARSEEEKNIVAGSAVKSA